jgi:hypothetical protein
MIVKVLGYFAYILEDANRVDSERMLRQYTPF